ncbi:IEC3 subunit of the Ino80 complex, chromatin re-modelling-domain-containing protein [Coniochaeta sp. 2T2.1]|nr:IEC3 subunit of the Ino80 complex, chromatin re-modelling-domain-containing protein [Coniochaeta sp. 2T2.1]
MDVDTPTRADRAIKTTEDDGHEQKMGDIKPHASYRSWKKKYRKMRVVFEHKMREGENLYKLEQKALETANRLAVENDRLLDLLLDVNNCAQIPPDKRIDLSLSTLATDSELSLPIVRPSTPTPKNGSKSYKQLLSEVPHFGFSQAAGRLPEIVISDLNTGRDSPADPQQGAPHPPTFLTADDIDNYLYQIDVQLAAERRAHDGDRDRSESPPVPSSTELLPTLAPIAGTHGQPPDRNAHPADLLEAIIQATSAHADPPTVNNPGSAARNLALRNPTSVYNWLRKHAPKTFLQDHEGGGGAAADHADETGSVVHGAKAKSSKGGGGDSKSKAPSSSRSKKAGGVGSSRAAKSKDAEAMDLDSEAADMHTTPSDKKGGASSSKRKRVVDDDPGYRPKGGSSRPRSKKRKSLGGDEAATPSAPPAKKKKITVKEKRAPEETEEEDNDEAGDAITARGVD